MNEATLIESPTITPDSSYYIGLMDSPPTYYQSTLGASDTFVQPQQLCSATTAEEAAAASGLNCSSMLITDYEPTGGTERFHNGSYLRGDGAPSM